MKIFAESPSNDVFPQKTLKPTQLKYLSSTSMTAYTVSSSPREPPLISIPVNSQRKCSLNYLAELIRRSFKERLCVFEVSSRDSYGICFIPGILLIKTNKSSQLV